MRVFRWVLAVALTALHIVMKAPVWALIARVDVVGGSSGYHRFMLVDQCIRRFGSWWLVGVRNTADWGWDMWDQANQYVAIAENSGLIPLICFSLIIYFGFRYIGKKRSAVQGDVPEERFVWAIGVALFSTAVAFVGIVLWDQTQVSWYALLAIVGAVTVTTSAPDRPVPIQLGWHGEREEEPLSSPVEPVSGVYNGGH